jgi:hypothetical protein
MGRHSGNYLAFTYVFVKVLYIANAIGQIFLLNVFMGRGFSLIGIQTMQRWWIGQDMDIVERFPRITMCKFVIRTLGDNIQPFAVQCLLPINIYNEKVNNSLFFFFETKINFVLDFSINLVLACICCYCFNIWSY